MSPHDPVTAAWAVLARSASAAGCAIALAEGEAAPWWSATFAGDVVWLTVRVGAAAERWLASLPEAELPIPGRFVADCRVDREADTALISLLILDAD